MRRIKHILFNIINSVLCRKAYVTLNYVHDYTNDKCKKYLNSLSIHIVRWNTAHIMCNFPIEDAEKLYKTLIKSNESVRIQLGDDALYEYLIVPKWAKNSIATDIRRCVL